MILFPATRIAIKGATIARKVVNNKAAGKLNMKKASTNFTNFNSTFATIAKPTKNMFVNAYSWFKTFINIYKKGNNDLQTKIQAAKSSVGKRFKFKTEYKNKIKQNWFDNEKSKFNEIKQEFGSLFIKQEPKTKKVKK